MQGIQCAIHILWISRLYIFPINMKEFCQSVEVLGETYAMQIINLLKEKLMLFAKNCLIVLS